jgi:hypothetical protein
MDPFPWNFAQTSTNGFYSGSSWADFEDFINSTGGSSSSSSSTTTTTISGGSSGSSSIFDDFINNGSGSSGSSSSTIVVNGGGSSSSTIDYDDLINGGGSIDDLINDLINGGGRSGGDSSGGSSGDSSGGSFPSPITSFCIPQTRIMYDDGFKFFMGHNCETNLLLKMTMEVDDWLSIEKSSTGIEELVQACVDDGMGKYTVHFFLTPQDNKFGLAFTDQASLNISVKTDIL